jgi:hypothetical protein
VSTTGRWDELFRDRRWRVAEEVSGEHVQGKGAPRIRVTFTRGLFEITAPGAFRSPLSTNLGRRGVLLQETDATGAADIPGSRMAVGAAAVKKAREQYSAVW